MTQHRILVAAGGTGGHVFPALAVMQALRSAGHEVLWIGTSRGLERRVADQSGLRLLELPFTGLRGKGLLALISLPLRLVRALGRCLGWLMGFRPDLVITFGGYVTVPVGLAARLLGKPLWVHEQNAVMGSANRLLSHLAERSLLSHQQTHGAPASAVFSGNPVRAELLRQGPVTDSLAQRTGPIRLLVVGGSLGARALNLALPLAVARVLAAGIPLQIQHQAGQDPQAQSDLKTSYEALGLAPPPESETSESALVSWAKVLPFLEDMDAAYRWADLVVCRAGASTLAELQALALPALLVPLPSAIDDHQRHNALGLAATGLAEVMLQTPDLDQQIAHALQHLSRADLVQRSRMALAVQQPDVAQAMADAIARRLSPTHSDSDHRHAP